MLAIIFHFNRVSSKAASIQRIIIEILATTWLTTDSTRISATMWISRISVLQLFLLILISFQLLLAFHHLHREFKARDFCVLSVYVRSRASIRSSWFHWRNSSETRINSTVIGHHWKAISTRRSIPFSAITKWISMRTSVRSTGPAASWSVSSRSLWDS